MTPGSYTTWEKMMTIFGALNLTDGGDGTVLLDTPYGQQQWVEVEPLLFHEVDGQDMVIFEEDDQGRIVRAFIHSQPRIALERLAWYESPGLHMPLLLGTVLIFLATVIAAPVSAIRARRRRGEAETQPRLARVARWMAVGVSALLVLFTAGLFFLIGTMTWYTPFFGTPPFLTALLVLPVLAAVLTVAVLVFTVLAWTGLGDPQRRPYWGIAGRVHYTLVTVAAVAFLWSLNLLNLLGWKF
jgi:hypothetical protein